jgi:hypothetical protein
MMKPVEQLLSGINNAKKYPCRTVWLQPKIYVSRVFVISKHSGIDTRETLWEQLRTYLSQVYHIPQALGNRSKGCRVFVNTRGITLLSWDGAVTMADSRVLYVSRVFSETHMKL